MRVLNSKQNTVLFGEQRVNVAVDIDVVDYVIIGFPEHESMKERKLL